MLVHLMSYHHLAEFLLSPGSQFPAEDSSLLLVLSKPLKKQCTHQGKSLQQLSGILRRLLIQRRTFHCVQLDYVLSVPLQQLPQACLRFVANKCIRFVTLSTGGSLGYV